MKNPTILGLMTRKENGGKLKFIMNCFPKIPSN